MDEGFRQLIDGLHASLEQLLQVVPVRYGALPREMPERGIYLFSEGERHLYVGRTNGIKRRLQNHCRPGGSHHHATFAFKLAREDTSRTRAAYRTEGGRADLVADPLFAAASVAAKSRLAAMDIRCIEVTDPVQQALLEIYVATVLETPYNDFDNH